MLRRRMLNFKFCREAFRYQNLLANTANSIYLFASTKN